MALITTAPETISGKITAIFKSVAQLSEEKETFDASIETAAKAAEMFMSERINLVINFTDSDGKPIYGVKAVYTDEDDQIAALSTQKAYGVFFKPVLDSGSAVLTAEFMGTTYVGSADLTDADVLLGVDAITFSQPEG